MSIGWGSRALRASPCQFFMRRRAFSLHVFCLLLAALAGCGATNHAPHPRSDNFLVPKSFHIFRTPSEDLTGSVRRRTLGAISVGGPQELASKPQKALTSRGSVWVFATAQHLLCIVHRRGGACELLKRASKQGLFFGAFQPPTRQQPTLHDFLVQGVVPDGVKRIALRVGKRRIRLRVKGNIVTATADAPIHVQRLLWR